MREPAEQKPIHASGEVMLDPDLSRPELLHELFERQADNTPTNPAIICGSTQLSYVELEGKANQLASFLRSKGIGKENCVALVLPRSPDVYVSLLATLKAGAAYVPIDPEYPSDRIAYILHDCDARALITTATLARRTGDFKGIVVELDTQANEIESQGLERVPQNEAATSWTDPCYVIYTSGTTGRPKGVLVEHRSACNLVRAEGRIFQVGQTDRVFQGFSIAFDASVEEIWLGFFSGAALVVGTQEMIHAGPELSRLLTQGAVTVLSCVPTLLSMLEEDIPTLRLLILGGEECPQHLVSRWCKPGRRVVNTYGPTEATVIATYADCAADRPVTIGRAVPNYQVILLDSQMQPVPAGAAGELYIGGVGVARGYVGQPKLTAERFITLRTGSAASAPVRLYKTGDLARLTPAGDIEFLGRADEQVKLRGYRIELSEIEAALMECPGVLNAAAALRTDAAGIQQLAGYVVPSSSASLDLGTIRGMLKSRLPAYMVPSILEPIAKLPTLPSGKVDRKSLPDPRTRPSEKPDAPRNPLEAKIMAVWSKLFAPNSVTLQAHFFLDLGGHSLLAASMVSELRKDAQFRGVSMLDVYNHPTIESLAAARSAGLSLSEPQPHTNLQTNPEFSPISKSKHFACGFLQLIGLYFVLGFFSLQWLAPYLTYTWMVEDEYSIIESVLGALGVLVGLYPLMLVTSILVKWTVIGRYKAGDYPLWGFYYFRCWLVNTVQSAIPIEYLSGTPLLNIYYRLMGAKIGANVHLGTDNFAIYDLLSIGDDSCIGTDASLLGYTVENGALRIGPVKIGRRCFIGTRAVIREHACLEDDSALEDLSMLPSGLRVPSGERWYGSPARPGQPAEGARDAPKWSPFSPRAADEVSAKMQPLLAGVRGSAGPEFANSSRSEASLQPGREDATAIPPTHASRPSRLRQVGFALLHILGLFLFPTLVLSAIFPGMILMNYLNYQDDYYSYLVVAPLVALSFVLLLCAEIVVIKWLLLGKVKPCSYPLHSFYYLRKWFVDQTMELSLDVLGPLYASVYLAPWYRLLGAKVGRRAEISTASFISPDLLSIDDESFIADSVSLGAARFENGCATIASTRIGKRSFIGNSALLPPNTTIGDNSLIGCLSIPPGADEPARDRNQPPNPSKPGELSSLSPRQEGNYASIDSNTVSSPALPLKEIKEGTAWLGSPPIFLPQRQESTAFAPEQTFNPSQKLRLQRALIELVRIILPSTGFIILTSLLFSVVVLIQEDVYLREMLLLFPLLYAGCGLLAVAFVVAMKWILVGKYKPGERPLWSTFVWRNELINALHEHLADLFLVEMLTGTPFVCWYFRLLGAKIGPRVYMETTDLTEFDLVRIGTEATLNADCTIQTHLFEDRVMKMSTVEIAPRSTVGRGALVLYDTKMEEGSSLGDLSLLMKGETLPAGTHWAGIPARLER